MSALSPEDARLMRETVRRGWGEEPGEPSSLGVASAWSRLHEQAGNVAQLAQLSPEPFDGLIADFPERIKAAGARQRELALQGLEDIEAMMAPGLTALETLRQRGASTNAPALALWRAFYNARSAVMALTPSG